MSTGSSVKSSSKQLSFNHLPSDRGTLLLFDIDDFKYINFSFGYDVGNYIINAIGKRLKDVFGGRVSRVGSNTFAVFIDRVEDREELKRKYERYAKTIPFRLKDETFSVSLSCGVACGSSDNLFRKAEIALLKAKSSGKAMMVFYSSEMGNEQEQISTTTKSLIKAIHNDSIQPYFQPIVDLRTNRVYGYEVLARIFNGNSMIHGDYVIRVADSLGMTPDIDRSVFLKAVPYINNEYYLFINLSMKYYIRELNFIWQTAKRKNLSLDRVVIEVTESQRIASKGIAQSIISIFKDLHAKVAIDDFGTGYSNFHYLKLFPVDIVKIDGAFIRNIKNNLKDLAVVKSIVSTSKYFRVKTLAEFIEDAETFDILREIGVTLGQGYFIGKPQPKPYKPKFMVK